jgi:hypothetical protein
VFLNFLNQLRDHHAKIGKSNRFETGVIKEWGEMVEGAACAFRRPKAEGGGYVVLVRSDSPDPLEKHLEHEFKHIHDGDLERLGK